MQSHAIQDQLCKIAPSHIIRGPVTLGGRGGTRAWDNAILHFGKLRFSMHYCGLMFSCAFVLHFFFCAALWSLDCTNEFLI